MSQPVPEVEKVYSTISRKLGVPDKEVQKVVESFYRGVRTRITTDEPCEIIMPFLGRLVPNKTYLKEIKENEVNSIGG